MARYIQRGCQNDSSSHRLESRNGRKLIKRTSPVSAARLQHPTPLPPEPRRSASARELRGREPETAPLPRTPIGSGSVLLESGVGMAEAGRISRGGVGREEAKSTPNKRDGNNYPSGPTGIRNCNCTGRFQIRLRDPTSEKDEICQNPLVRHAGSSIRITRVSSRTIRRPRVRLSE